MCSIFLAVSRTTPVDLEKCRNALSFAKSRGPDFTAELVDKNIYLGYNVLSITGSPKHKFNETGRYWLGYNGELYNTSVQNEKTDTEILLKKIETQGINTALSNIDGMYGLALYNKQSSSISLARDIQGEKTLYYYFDNNWFIASSTLASIEIFFGKLKLDPYLLHCYFHTRHFLTCNKTIYENVFQVKPGTCVNFDAQKHTIVESEYDSLFNLIDRDLINENTKKDENDLTKELDELLDKSVSQMITDKEHCISFSGGVDSSLVAAYVAKYTNNYNLIATNCVGKDYIADNLNVFQPFFKQPIQTLQISEKEWCNSLFETYSILRTPLHSHNYNTKTIFSKFLQKNNIKVCYGGEGADEIFGGYEFYKTLPNTTINISPYSSYLNLPLRHNWCSDEFKKYIDNVWQKAYEKFSLSLHATSFADLYLEVVDDGLRNCDQICGWFGIEGRSLFLRKKILQFALNLPEKYKRGKPLLINLFKKHFPSVTIKPKQGFAGFPNETCKYYSKAYDRFSILGLLNIHDYQETKEITWKLLNTELFYECHNSRYLNNPLRS